MCEGLVRSTGRAPGSYYFPCGWCHGSLLLIAGSNPRWAWEEPS